jgi:hypothetical protein
MSTSRPTSGTSPWSAWQRLKRAGGHLLVVLVGMGVWYACLLVVAVFTSTSSAQTGLMIIVPTGNAVLDPGDMDALARALPGTTLGRAVVPSRAAFTDTSPSVAVQSVDAEFFAVYGWKTAEGALFTPADDVRSSPVAVLGAQAARSLFADTASPIGRSLHVQNVAFTVVGVLAPVDDAALADSVYVPLQTGRVRLVGVQAPTEIVMNTSDPSVAEAATNVLTSRYRTAVPFEVQAAATDTSPPTFPQLVADAADRVQTEFLRGKGFA